MLSIKTTTDNLTDSIFSIFYPQGCQICGDSVEKQSDGGVCAKCWSQTRLFEGEETLCVKCGALLLSAKSPVLANCLRCADDFYDYAKAVGVYEKALLKTILRLKNEPFLPRRAAEFLRKTFEDSTFHDTDRIIPVPLSPRRLKLRGYNQAEILATVISKQSGVNIDKTNLIRLKQIELGRHGMDRKARFESVKNIFSVQNPKLIANQTILLVDDVFTSGATVSACGKVLKDAGAAKVYVLTLARAV